MNINQWYIRGRKIGNNANSIDNDDHFYKEVPMGQMKHHAAEIEAREACARQIAVDAGVLKHCEYHPGDYFHTEVDIQDAYRIAASQFKEGYYHDLFTNQRDFTDTIKKVVEDVWVDECPSCTDRDRQFDKHATDPEP